MRAVVTRAEGAWRSSTCPSPGEPGRRRGARPARGGRLCGSDFHYFLGELGFERLTRASRATRPPASSRPSGRTARRSSGGRARRDVAARGVRALLSVPDRAQNVCVEHQPDRRPPRRRAPGAAACCPPRRSSRSDDRDPALAALIEPVSIAVRAVVRGARRSEERRPSSSAPGRSGRRSPPRRSTGERPCCSSIAVASRLAAGAAHRSRDAAPGRRGRSRRRGPRMGRRRRPRGRLRGDRRPRGRPDRGRARRPGRARGHRRALAAPMRRSAWATWRSRRSTCSA